MVITSKDIEGWLVASENGVTVALDITLTASLQSEGIARELINRIQNARKDAGLEVTDTIDLSIQKNELLNQAVLDNQTYIQSETLATQLNLVENVEGGEAIEFYNIKTQLGIKKN